MHGASFAVTLCLCHLQFRSTLMYNHREGDKRVDVVDLDPYGTAAPFIDAAVQCIRDDGCYIFVFVNWY
jgi:tRNA G26 N,N-dimethylase Trm1